MSTDRRSFLQWAGVAAGALGLGSLPTLGYAGTPERRAARTPVGLAPEPLSILVIGGTGFTGPEQVEHALARGHKVTVINRNRRRPDFFKGNAEVEQLIGDLDADMSVLKGRTFDAVLDIPTTAPYWVRNVAQYMKGRTKHYTFISTLSVYADNKTVGADESDPTLPMPADLDPYTPDPAMRGRYYGQLKAFSEKLVKETYPNSLIIRPGLIVGPLDPSDRFTYWPVRINQGGEVMAPGNPTDRVQFIDSRPGRVDDSHDRGEGDRHVQRHWSGQAAHDGRAALRHQGGDHGGSAVHLGARRLPYGSGSSRLAPHAGMDRSGSRHRRFFDTQCLEGSCEGADFPAARGNGEGHDRVGEDADPGAAEGIGRGNRRRHIDDA
jgi:hypothetical protein